MISYWNWFLKGNGYKPGYRRIFNVWFLIHVAIGLTITLITNIRLSDSVNVVLIFMFSSLMFNILLLKNIHALLQSKEIERLSNYHKGGIIEYVYTFQTSTLIILTSFVLWTLSGLLLFEIQNFSIYFGINVILFTVFSLSVREFWHIIMGIYALIIIQKIIKEESV